MLHLFEFSAILSKLGFCATFIVNIFFINLTISYTKVITGTYRKMLVIFASTCIIFSAVEMIAQPCIHNFNGGLVYFSLNDNPRLSQEFLTYSIVFYAACYVDQLVFIGIQFVFRCLTLDQHSLLDSFRGRVQVIWILYFFAMGILYGSLAAICLKSDDYSDDYMKLEVSRVYSKEIKDTPRLLAVVYDKNGAIRWSVITFLSGGTAIIGSQYVIIIVCSSKMLKSMKTKLGNFSQRNRKLELQFFKALAVQITLPTLLITIPIGFVLLVPVLNLKMSLQTSMIYALYSLYPPLDSIATMMIIKEYRISLKAMIGDATGFLKEKDSRTTDSAAGPEIVMRNLAST